MKTRLMIASFILALGLVAYAQSLPINANIPFDFIVGEKTMPAGDYALQPVSLNPAAILLRSDDGKQAALSLTFPLDNSPTDELKLVFNRYGDAYFLSQIWNGNYKLGVTKSKKELGLKAVNVTPVEVALVANK